jgi:uncharacterized protein (TIGR02246 family)
MKFRAVATSCIVLAMACQPAEQTAASDEATEKASGDIAAEVGQMRDAWIAAANRDEASTVAALYTDDAIFMGVDGNLVGRAAIETSLAESFKAGSDLTVSESSSEVVGDVVYSTGEWSQKVTTPDGKTADLSGSYLVISRLQADGSWKIVRHVSIPKPAAPQS